MFLFFLFGTIVGSFIAVLSERLPQGKSIFLPPSHCLHCQRFLSWYELLPVISILVLRFRCRTCKKKIPLHYLMVEILTGFLFLWYSTQLGNTKSSIWLFWLCYSLCLSITDIHYLIIDPGVLYVGAAILWGFHWWLGQPLLFSSMVVTILLLASIHLLLPKSMGLGDYLVLFVWAPWLTLVQISWLLIISSVIGMIVFLVSHLLQKPIIHLPFIPCLSGGLTIIFLMSIT